MWLDTVEVELVGHYTDGIATIIGSTRNVTIGRSILITQDSQSFDLLHGTTRKGYTVDFYISPKGWQCGIPGIPTLSKISVVYPSNIAHYYLQ